MSAHMNGCEIVFSKPIGSGLSSYARWASGSGTKKMSRYAQHGRQYSLIKRRFT